MRPLGGLVLRNAFKPRGHSSRTGPPCGTRLLQVLDNFEEKKDIGKIIGFQKLLCFFIRWGGQDGVTQCKNHNDTLG